MSDLSEIGTCRFNGSRSSVGWCLGKFENASHVEEDASHLDGMLSNTCLRHVEMSENSLGGSGQFSAASPHRFFHT